MAKKKKNFPSLSSLESLRNVLDEAETGRNDRNRTIMNSAMPEVLAGALGAGAGFAGSFVALSTLGVAGLGAAGITSGLAAAGGGLSTVAVASGVALSPMVAGIAVLAAPAVVLTGIGVGTVAVLKNKRLKHEKNSLLQRVIKTQHTIVVTLNNEVNKTQERADYLNSLNILLQRAIQDLRTDLRADVKKIKTDLGITS